MDGLVARNSRSDRPRINEVAKTATLIMDLLEIRKIDVIPLKEDS